MDGREEQQQHERTLANRWREIQGADSWEGLLDPFDPTLKSEILRYGEFAKVCYIANKNIQILVDKKLFAESSKLQECGYEIKHYIYAYVRLSTSNSRQKRRKWIGFIAVCTDPIEIRRLGRRDIVVAFRGTTSKDEWFQNLKDKVAPWQDLPGTEGQTGVGVHAGFLWFYTDGDTARSEPSAREIITGGITSLLEEYRGQQLSITVTGHSLGGALATMSGYDIKLLLRKIGEPSIPVTVFTFASPRVGNEAFASHMTRIGVNVFRVKVKTDCVPKVPGICLNEKRPRLVECLKSMNVLQNWAYYHVGIELQLNIIYSPNLRLMDKLFLRHYLKTYLQLIDEYQGTNRHFQSSQNNSEPGSSIIN